MKKKVERFELIFFSFCIKEKNPKISSIYVKSIQVDDVGSEYLVVVLYNVDVVGCIWGWEETFCSITLYRSSSCILSVFYSFTLKIR